MFYPILFALKIALLQTEQRRNSLKLEDLMPLDSGNYTCVISNRHGQLRHTYVLQVFSMYIIAYIM